MKHLTTAIAVVVIATLMSFNVKDQVYKIDNQKSKITWIGKKVTGQHVGTISLAEGSFTLKGNKISGGSFIIDMTSLKDSEGNAKLEGHLKSDDFFSTDKNPTATFVTSKIESRGGDQYIVKGSLTVKGITNEIEFPAIIQVSNGQISAKAKILVDRTKFDIKFRSGNFFQNLGDKAIEDNFELDVELVGGSNV